MKSPKSTGMFRPFEGLKELLESREFMPQQHALDRSDQFTDSNSNHDADLKMFNNAMAGVKKISRKNCVEQRAGLDKHHQPQTVNENDIVLKLNNLIKHGTGFVVADTPEYIEGRGCDAHPEIARRLHRGDFAIQGHIDLHGLNVTDAHQAFEDFLQQSIATNKRVVMIIHGRGLSSPVKPILKANVFRWLSSGPWNKWVMAFSSARWCDGGAGATYVLLRQRPLTKRIRKKWKAKEDLKQ